MILEFDNISIPYPERYCQKCLERTPSKWPYGYCELCREKLHVDTDNRTLVELYVKPYCSEYISTEDELATITCDINGEREDD